MYDVDYFIEHSQSIGLRVSNKNFTFNDGKHVCLAPGWDCVGCTTTVAEVHTRLYEWMLTIDSWYMPVTLRCRFGL